MKIVEVIYDNAGVPMGYCEENFLTGSKEAIVWTLETILKDIKEHPTPLTKKDFTGTIDGVTSANLNPDEVFLL